MNEPDEKSLRDLVHGLRDALHTRDEVVLDVPARGRNLRVYTDVAEALGCRCVPLAVDDQQWRLQFARLTGESFHDSAAGAEKYGAESPWSQISKLEEPSFLMGLEEALGEVGFPGVANVLDLGVNTGDEFSLMGQMAGEGAEGMQFVGVDHSPSAIAVAKERFPGEPYTFHENDVNRLDELGLPRFDLIVSVATLHSPGIESKRLFMDLVQKYLQPSGAVIIGFPNCRWIGGEAVYGARTKNRRETDLSLLVKDIHFIKKYLQQHRFKVRIFGKNYLFLTGIKHS